MTENTQNEDSLNIGEIKIKAEEMLANCRLVKDSIDNASTHEWLYHCTSGQNFLSMVKSNEMWLSNLQCVNDREEVERIDLPEFENSYFIGCFTFDPDIHAEHWYEYGGKNGVLWAAKQSYFKPAFYFLNEENKHLDDDSYHVYKIQDALNSNSTSEQNDNMFVVCDNNFYQVVYDDELKKKSEGASSILIDGNILKGRSISADVAGIIKSTHGICKGKNGNVYEKEWASEKEVRLKVCISGSPWENGRRKHNDLNQGHFFCKVAVPFSEEAFQNIRLRLAPDFENPQAFVRKLQEFLPKSIIEMF